MFFSRYGCEDILPNSILIVYFKGEEYFPAVSKHLIVMTGCPFLLWPHFVIQAEKASQVDTSL